MFQMRCNFGHAFIFIWLFSTQPLVVHMSNPAADYSRSHSELLANRRNRDALRRMASATGGQSESPVATLSPSPPAVVVPAPLPPAIRLGAVTSIGSEPNVRLTTNSADSSTVLNFNIPRPPHVQVGQVQVGKEAAVVGRKTADSVVLDFTLPAPVPPRVGTVVAGTSPQVTVQPNGALDFVLPSARIGRVVSVSHTEPASVVPSQNGAFDLYLPRGAPGPAPTIAPTLVGLTPQVNPLPDGSLQFVLPGAPQLRVGNVCAGTQPMVAMRQYGPGQYLLDFVLPLPATPQLPQSMVCLACQTDSDTSAPAPLLRSRSSRLVTSPAATVPPKEHTFKISG